MTNQPATLAEEMRAWELEYEDIDQAFGIGRGARNMAKLLIARPEIQAVREALDFYMSAWMDQSEGIDALTALDKLIAEVNLLS